MQVKGEVLQVEQGDVIDGAEVVAIDTQGVSFQYSGTRWTEALFHKDESRPVIVAKANSSAATAAPQPLPTELPEPVAPFTAPVN